jgi:hypothetical protein
MRELPMSGTRGLPRSLFATGTLRFYLCDVGLGVWQLGN